LAVGTPPGKNARSSIIDFVDNRAVAAVHLQQEPLVAQIGHIFKVSAAAFNRPHMAVTEFPQFPANPFTGSGRLYNWPRGWPILEIVSNKLFISIIIAQGLRGGALAKQCLIAIGIFRVIRAIAVARVGLTGKDNDPNGGKQTRNHDVLNEKTRFLHPARLEGEYGAILLQSR
jgi:hypothetical protein